jgi:glucose/mannose-6-phosphate isomerase
MASPLDDRSYVTRLDPKGMLTLTEAFPDQMRQAAAIAESVHLPLRTAPPRLVVLTGLGGSASGGDFVRALFEEQGHVPFIVNRDYSLPNFVEPNDLVFCASYSGNTEETLSAYHNAKSQGANIICVTSGGQLKANADADGFPVIQIQGGQPPRTALGWMMMPVVVACVKLGLIPDANISNAAATLDGCVERWTVEAGDNAPKRLAQEFHGAFPIIYGLGGWQGLVANRWRCQINENSKYLCSHHTFPELNHNEILGWIKADEQGVRKYAGAVLADGNESMKMLTRFLVTEKLVGDKCHFTRVDAEGSTLLEQMLSLILFGDFVSLYLAALNGVDPENIDSINTLKDALSKVG